MRPDLEQIHTSLTGLVKKKFLAPNFSAIDRRMILIDLTARGRKI